MGGAQMEKSLDTTLERAKYKKALFAELAIHNRTFWSFVSRGDTTVPPYPEAGSRKDRIYYSVEKAHHNWANFYSHEAEHLRKKKSVCEGLSTQLNEVKDTATALEDKRNARVQRVRPESRIHRNTLGNDCHVMWWEMEKGGHAFVRVPFVYAMVARLMTMDDCEFPGDEFPTVS